MRKSHWQLFRFVYIYMNSQVSVFLIPPLIGSSRYQGWIAVLGGFGISVVYLLFTYWIGKMGKDVPWLDFGSHIAGKWGHKFFLLLIAVWGMYYLALDFENFYNFFGTVYMRETPAWAIHLAVGLAIFYTCRRGFDTLVYMSEAIFLITILVVACLVYLFYPSAEFSMLPALIHYHDPGLAARDSVIISSWLSEWVVFLFIGPEYHFDSRTFKNMFFSGILVVITLMLGWLFTLLNFRPSLGAQMQYPYLELIRGSSSAGMSGNTDSFFIGIWTASLFIHGSFLLYIASKSASKLVGAPNIKWTSGILMLGSLVIAILYSRNPTVFRMHYDSLFLTGVWLFIESIPVYYFLLSLLRFRKLKAGT